jgi:tryptophanyl-tRNA synthetase
MIAQKTRKAKTDPEPLPASPAALDGRPEARNLVAIYAVLGDETIEQVLARFEGQGFGAFKTALAERLIESMAPIRRRFLDLKDDQARIDRVLEQGAEKARTLAAPVLDGAYKALGLQR